MLMKIMAAVIETSVGVILMVFIVNGKVEKYLPRFSCKHQSCQLISVENNNYISRFLVDGKELLIDTRYEYFRVKCSGASVLDSTALPSADLALKVNVLILNHCPLPTTRSIVAILKAFNVNLLRAGNHPRIELLFLPATPPLSALHLIGLEELASLTVSGDSTERVIPKPGFLAPLNDSKMLWQIQLENIEIHYLDLPVSLNRLSLLKVYVEQLSEMISFSPKLQDVHVESKVALSLHSVGPGLKELMLISPVNSVNVTSVPLLSKPKLTYGTAEQPVPLSSCDKLKRVSMIGLAARVLPDGWFANCHELYYLKLKAAPYLTALPEKLLLNAKVLHELLVTNTALQTLPDGLLKHTPNLKFLTLSGNRLLKLSSMIYLPSTLTNIDLSSNDLDVDAVEALASLWRLVHLNLSLNPRLGDLCKESGFSAIHNATALLRLTLSRTGVSRICNDWRLKMRQLLWLDLSHTNITKLSNEDLHFNRSSGYFTTVTFFNAPLKVVEITHDFYKKLKEETVKFSRNVRVEISAALLCNCQMYWTRLALEFLNQVELHCDNRRLLKDMKPDELVCDAETECSVFEQLPTLCACHWRPDTEAPGGVVHVNCSHRHLQDFPQLHAIITPPRHYHLLLAHNNITQLQVANLNGNITVLDLRNNSIQRVDSETAEQIARGVGLLRLAGNPIQCDCNAAPLVGALHRRAARTSTDIGNATCHDGRSLLTVQANECPASLPNSYADNKTAYVLAGGLAALLVIIIAVGATLVSQSRRFFLRAVLHRWGCLWRAAEPETDDARPYDVFITFSHEDEAVALQLVQRLEPTYRVCVHYRDWAPGRFIAEQITESVESSRRTVALVSRNFLSSAWARAEFRSAHSEALRDTSHRLIVVLLEDPEVLQLDEQLSRYIRSNTYVRWGDPWFWDKLQVALPPKRPPPAAERNSCVMRALSLPSP